MMVIPEFGSSLFPAKCVMRREQKYIRALEKMKSTGEDDAGYIRHYPV
jgi:hypothetical protein